MHLGLDYFGQPVYEVANDANPNTGKLGMRTSVSRLTCSPNRRMSSILSSTQRRMIYRRRELFDLR